MNALVTTLAAAALLAASFPASGPARAADQCGDRDAALASLDTAFRTKVERVLKAVRKTYPNAKIIEGKRSAKRQQCLKKAGKSKTTDSKHLCGLAVDVIDNTKGFSWDKDNPFWKALGAAARAEGLKWGGDFSSFFDGPHVESTRSCP